MRTNSKRDFDFTPKCYFCVDKKNSRVFNNVRVFFLKRVFGPKLKRFNHLICLDGHIKLRKCEIGKAYNSDHGCARRTVAHSIFH